MKIAVVAPTQIPARRANTVQVMKMAQALVQAGHSVRLAGPVDPPNPALEKVSDSPGRMPGWEALAHHYGLKHAFPVDWLPGSPALRRYDYGWRAVRWAQRWGADLLYTRLPQAAVFASWLRMATIFEVHDLPQGRVGPLLFRSFFWGKGARRLVVITQALAGDLAQKFGPQLASNLVIAPDGVDLERYAGLPDPQTARSRLPLLSERGVKTFTAGYTGHLYPGRGAELLLEVAARLPQMNFLIAGGDPQDVARFQSYARDCGLDNVLFTGFVPNAELPGYQAACEVLLMPYQRQVSASSGGDIARYLSPMKLFEYLACGRAILSSDLPVLREVLTSENAVLLPPDHSRAWVEALQDLLGEPGRRLALGKAAQQEARKHTWEARARRVLAGFEGTNL